MLAFSINRAVESVQNLKKNWVNSTVFDTKLAESLNSFVDTQTEYTKSMFNNFERTGMSLAGYAIGKAQEAAKTVSDWAEKFTQKS